MDRNQNWVMHSNWWIEWSSKWDTGVPGKQAKTFKEESVPRCGKRRWDPGAGNGIWVERQSETRVINMFDDPGCSAYECSKSFGYSQTLYIHRRTIKWVTTIGIRLLKCACAIVAQECFCIQGPTASNESIRLRSLKMSVIVVGQERAMNTISAPNHNAKCKEEDRW